MHKRPDAILFICLFAAQAAVLVLAPLLPDVAAEFGITTATAGQLRSLSGIAGGATAVALGLLAWRLSVRGLLIAGLSLLAGGSVVEAAAPTFAVLAAAQLAVGAGVAVVLSAGVAAAAEWSQPEDRTRVLSWALLGQPAAWVVGMPLIGVVAQAGWRYAVLAVPVAAAALALVATCLRPAEPRATHAARAGAGSLLREPGITAWAAGELLAYAAWGGTLVYAGALFIESYGLSLGATGLMLGAAAAAYFPGTLLARRFVERDARRILIRAGFIASAGTAAFGALRPAAWVSAALFALIVSVAAARALAGSSLGLQLAPAHRVAVGSIRAGATQFGYLLGSVAGGLALASGGYAGLGAVLSVLFALASVPHLSAAREGLGKVPSLASQT